MSTQPDHDHCSTCYKPNECKSSIACSLIRCPNECNKNLRFHKCKLNDHLNELCTNRIRHCTNKVFGCKWASKASQLIRHLDMCPANIQECPAVRVRKLIRQTDKQIIDHDASTKWADPILRQQNDIEAKSVKQPMPGRKSLKDLLYNIDLDNFRKHAIDNNKKFKFNWIYKHLVVDRSDSDKTLNASKQFDLITSLKKPIKSQIFDHIEIDSCVLNASWFDLYRANSSNSKLKTVLSKTNVKFGCKKCHTLISYLEREFFARLTSNLKFSTILRYTYDFNEFKQGNKYKSQDFLRLLQENYSDIMPKQANDDWSLVEESALVNERLDADNRSIVNRLDMSKTFQIQVFDELFNDSSKLNKYTVFRHKESHYQHKCSVLLKRQQYSNHLHMFHNLIEHNFFDDSLDKHCPFAVYGCDYFFRKIKFYNSADRVHDGELIANNGNLAFDYYRDNECLANHVDYATNDYFLRLPLEVVDLIMDNLDSYSLFNLAMTSRVSDIFSNKNKSHF
jgi:hypothetical protein